MGVLVLSAKSKCLNQRTDLHLLENVHMQHVSCESAETGDGTCNYGLTPILMDYQLHTTSPAPERPPIYTLQLTAKGKDISNRA